MIGECVLKSGAYLAIRIGQHSKIDCKYQDYSITEYCFAGLYWVGSILFKEILEFTHEFLNRDFYIVYYFWIQF